MSDQTASAASNGDASSIDVDEDTTVNPENLAERHSPRGRRRRRRLTSRVRRHVVRSNALRMVLSIFLGIAVVAASTYLARKSTDFDITLIRSRR
jgi:hypothetical protein